MPPGGQIPVDPSTLQKISEKDGYPTSGKSLTTLFVLTIIIPPSRPSPMLTAVQQIHTLEMSHMNSMFREQLPTNSFRVASLSTFQGTTPQQMPLEMRRRER